MVADRGGFITRVLSNQNHTVNAGVRVRLWSRHLDAMAGSRYAFQKRGWSNFWNDDCIQCRILIRERHVWAQLYFAPIRRRRVVKARPRNSLKVPYSGESTTSLTTAGFPLLVAFCSTPRRPKYAPRK